MRRSVQHSSNEIDVQRIISDTTPFAVKEAYRSLYSNLLYLPIEDSCKKLVVTSAYPGEGKTSLSINVAITIAINSPESRVLVVDADMRSPRVPGLLNIDGRVHGLSEYLAGIDAAPSFTETSYPNLKVMTSGACNANTPGLISSTRMKKFMEYCNENFDYVIIDTPPINVVADALLLNECVNGYVLVTRADYSDVNALSDAIERLKAAEANIFGVVLCSYDSKNSGKGYGRYGKYGRYGRYGAYGYGEK